jgi:hypothetical protein
MTRSLTIVVLFVVSLSVTLSGREAAGQAAVRGLDAWANEALQRGRGGAVLVRTLLAVVAASDLIVHVESADGLPHGLAGMTRFVAATAQHRYVRITLSRQLAPDARAATLAHELQHACELARSQARSREEMQHLYEAIGYRITGRRNFYETSAAATAGARAWAELRGHTTVVHSQH